MNIEEAKSIQLEDYLRRMGFNPVKQQGDSIWYCSPFREEKTPSFKVSATYDTISASDREGTSSPWRWSFKRRRISLMRLKR